jgi:serine/threonine protein kinase
MDYFRCRVFSAIRRFDLGHPIGKDLSVVELLGQGLTGITFKVQDTTSGDIYALKFVTVDHLYEEDRVRRFIKRSARLHSLEHPNIVRIRDVRETEYGFVAIVMEFVEGRNLAKLLAMGQKFEIDEAFRVVREIGDIVAVTHGDAILHRNLRPSNVILTPEDQVKVIDFAIPAVAPANPKHPVAAYVAPEVLKDPEAIDQKSDIYSLGKILYQLMTGLNPARIVLDKAPANLRNIIAKATAERPEARYEQIDEFIHDLDSELSLDATEETTEEADAPANGNNGPKRTFVADEESQIRILRRNQRPAATPVQAREESAMVRARQGVPPPPKPPPEPEPVIEELPNEEPIEEDQPIEESIEGGPAEIKYPMKLQGHKGYIHTICVNSNNSVIASGASDSSIRVWKFGAFDNPEVLTGHRGYVYSVGFTKQANQLVSVGMDGNIRSWNIDKAGDVNVAQVHNDRIFSLCVDSDRMKAYTAGMDGKIKMIDLAQLKEEGELSGHAERVYTMALSRDGKFLASGSMDKTVKLWSIEKKADVFTLKGHEDRIYALAFSADGKRIFSGSMDETIRIWNRESGKELLTLKGHQGHVYCLAVTPDGAHLVSGAMDKMVKIWDLKTNKVVKTVGEHEGTVSCLAMSPDGKFLVTGSYDSIIRVWDFKKLLASRD